MASPGEEARVLEALKNAYVSNSRLTNTYLYVYHHPTAFTSIVFS